MSLFIDFASEAEAFRSQNPALFGDPLGGAPGSPMVGPEGGSTIIAIWNEALNFLDAIEDNTAKLVEGGMGVTAAMPEIEESAQERLHNSLEAMKEAGDSMGSSRGQKALSLLNQGIAGLKSSATGAALSALAAFGAGALAPFSSVLETITTLGEVLGTGFIPIANDINMLLLQLLPYMQQGSQWISSTYDKLKIFFTDIPGGFEEIMALFETADDRIIAGLEMAWVQVKIWFEDRGDSIEAGLEVAWGRISIWFEQRGDAIEASLETAWGKVSMWWEGLGTSIVSSLTTAWVDVTTWFNDLGSSIRDAIESGIQVLWDFFTNLPQQIVNNLSGAGQTIAQGIQNLLS